MRKNIFELLNNSELDLDIEYRRINELFEQTYFNYSHSLKDYIDKKEFLNWEGRGRFLDIDEAMQQLEITDTNFRYGVNLEKLILYIEFIINMVNLLRYTIFDDTNKRIIKLLKENINGLLEDLNYKVYKNNEEQFIIIEKDIITTAIAETMPDICDDVIEYRRVLLKGNIEEKQIILKKLSNKIEPLKTKFKGTEYNKMSEDVNFLLNNLNIRHNNLEGNKRQEYTVNMSCEDLEKWYDRTYDAILGLLIIDKYVDLKDDLKDLKTHYKSC